ncbi:MAG TPA: hypothetical protein VJN88_04335 [Ktedonobacterales bacterium]|nr:hypothetical protein [Ktedonobacterales bacterium]
MVGAFAAVTLPSTAKIAKAAAPVKPFCTVRPAFCTETAEPWNYQGQYTGHDEPSLLFYSNTPGSGNNNLYQLTLPSDPPTLPNNAGTGGTWNFQLHPAFWFGMAMCDNQSAPNPGATCTPDSDNNIYTSTNPNSERYLGKTPGSAFMEMQFYPPGWGNVGSGISCGPDNTQWCAALNIDSFSSNSNTGQVNNAACLNATGEEYVNYAIITKSGHSQAPADPLRQTILTFSTTADTLEMNSGDKLEVYLHDTDAGFQVVIHDATTGQTGSMTASIANGFGHPLFQPTASSCTDQPYTFHPEYSTSGPNTRVLWAAHSYNVAYSDEIGHSEYCNAADPNTGACLQAGVNDPNGLDSDDNGCQTLPLVPSNQPFTMCTATENDFDGPEYQHNWPGSNPNPTADQAVHASPVTITSPLFRGEGGKLRNFSRVAFENDLPRVEGKDTSPNNACQRHVSNPMDPHPGQGCIDPPNGATFYPIFSAVRTENGSCVWQEGDAFLPNTINNFGGTPTAEYGGLLLLNYPAPGFTVTQRYNDFRQVLEHNPCTSGGGGGGGR